MDASFAFKTRELSDNRSLDISRSQKIHMHTEAAQYFMASTFTIFELTRPET